MKKIVEQSDKDPSNYCDASGQVAPFDEVLPNKDSRDNSGKTDSEEFEANKKNQSEICVAKTKAGECEACFVRQGNSDRIYECKGF